MSRSRKSEGMEPLATHGSAKVAEPTDPLDLVGTLVPGGEIDELARSLIEEYAAMGYDAKRILELFRQPDYLAVHSVYRIRGEDAVCRLIDGVLAECGVFRVTEVDSAPPVSACPPQPIPLPTASEDED